MAHAISMIDGFPLRKNDSIIDCAFISEENFLLVIFLTAQADLIILYKTVASIRIEHSSANKFYAPSKRGANFFLLVSLTVDASVVILALSNMDIILIPLKYLMPTSWGRDNILVQKPTKLSFDFTQVPDKESFPTSMFSFTSKKSETFLVVGDTFGDISVIDLGHCLLSVRLNCAEGIRELSSFVNDNGLYAMAMTRSDSYFVVPLESRGKSVRETLAAVVPSQLSNISQSHRIAYLPLNSRSSNCASKIAEIQRDMHTITIKNSIFDNTGTLSYELSNDMPNIKKLQYTPKTLFALGDHEVYVAYHFLTISFYKVQAFDKSNSHFALIPCCQKNENENELEECLIVLPSGAFWMKPNRSIHSVIADYIMKTNFQTQLLGKLAENLNKPTDAIYGKVLKAALADNYDERNLDGFISLGFEINYPINKIVEVLSHWNCVHLLLPFLQIRCEKDPSDGPTRQLLFNAYISKLAKFDYDNSECHSRPADENGQVLSVLSCSLEAQQQKRNEIEEEIRQFLIQNIKFTSNVKVLAILLKHSLYSCAAALFSSGGASDNLLCNTIVRHFAELTSWRDQIPRPGFLKCLSLIDWPAGEPMGQVVVSKMILALPSLSSLQQFQAFHNIAGAMLKRSLGFAMTLFLVSAICLLECITVTNECDNIHKHIQLSCGSNCTAALADVGGLTFWGEFAAGALRLSNEARQRNALGGGRSKRCGEPSRKLAKDLPKPGGTAVPKIISLPTSIKIKSVACGTKHILLLTIDRRILSWGQNNYGQCGNGSRLPVAIPTIINDVGYGRVANLYAGHYHSALINEIGEVWLWGWGMYGQLATGDSNDRFIPTRTNLIRGISDVSLGYAHSLFLLNDGSVWGCGATANGQLGRDFSKISNRSLNCPKIQNKIISSTNVDVKMFTMVRVRLPVPAERLSSRYFHGVAICTAARRASTPPDAGICELPNHRETSVPPQTQNSHSDSPTATQSSKCLEGDFQTIFEWGECPQTIRMRTFLMKQLRGKQRIKSADAEVSTSTLSRALANRFRASKTHGSFTFEICRNLSEIEH